MSSITQTFTIELSLPFKLEGAISVPLFRIVLSNTKPKSYCFPEMVSRGCENVLFFL